MSRNGIVSAEEIMRRVKASPGGDIQDTDILAVKGKKPIPFTPSRRIGHSVTRSELVGEYVRYLTALHEIRKDLRRIPEEERQDRILREAEMAAARHFEEES